MPSRIVAIVLALVLGACAHHRLVVPEPVPASGYQAVTTHAYFWGLSEPTAVAELCDENAMVEVRIRTSLAHALAATLTLGAWMPARLEYKCGKRSSQEGVIGGGR